MPLMLLIWSLDSMLFLVVLRMISDAAMPAARWNRALQDIVDPIFTAVEGVVRARLSRPLRNWHVRVIVIAGLVLMRYFWVAIVVAMS